MRRVFSRVWRLMSGADVWRVLPQSGADVAQLAPITPDAPKRAKFAVSGVFAGVFELAREMFARLKARKGAMLILHNVSYPEKLRAPLRCLKTRFKAMFNRFARYAVKLASIHAEKNARQTWAPMSGERSRQTCQTARADVPGTGADVWREVIAKVARICYHARAQNRSELIISPEML